MPRLHVSDDFLRMTLFTFAFAFVCFDMYKTRVLDMSSSDWDIVMLSQPRDVAMVIAQDTVLSTLNLTIKGIIIVVVLYVIGVPLAFRWVSTADQATASPNDGLWSTLKKMICIIDPPILTMYITAVIVTFVVHFFAMTLLSYRSSRTRSDYVLLVRMMYVFTFVFVTAIVCASIHYESRP